MPGIGAPEIIVVLIIALVVFGPKRLPELGRSIGRGMREFKESVTGKDDDEDRPRIEPVEQVETEEPPLEGEVVHERKS
jgi:sec-independent protein translocase protein TatA